jgi:hypothetical protein
LLRQAHSWLREGKGHKVVVSIHLFLSLSSGRGQVLHCCISLSHWVSCYLQRSLLQGRAHLLARTS